jgi:hypothetical protein
MIEHMFDTVRPMATGVRTIDEAITSVVASASTVRDHVTGLAAPQLKSLLGDFQRARSAMDATWFRILTELEGANAHISDGARDTVTFVSNNTGESMGDVQRDLDAASKLTKMPEVADQVEERALSAAKARELARLSADVPVHVREDIARRAEHLSVRQIRDQVTRGWRRRRVGPPGHRGSSSPSCCPSPAPDRGGGRPPSCRGQLKRRRAAAGRSRARRLRSW